MEGIVQHIKGFLYEPVQFGDVVAYGVLYIIFNYAEARFVRWRERRKVARWVAEVKARQDKAGRFVR